MNVLGKFSKKEPIISRETAEGQLNLFLSHYRIDLNKGEDTKSLLNECAEKIIDAIMEGSVSIKTHQEGYPEITQKLRSGEVLVYRELRGQDRSAMGKVELSDIYGRIYAICGSLTGVGSGAIETIKSWDLIVLESIGFLFIKM